MTVSGVSSSFAMVASKELPIAIINRLIRTDFKFDYILFWYLNRPVTLLRRESFSLIDFLDSLDLLKRFQRCYSALFFVIQVKPGQAILSVGFGGYRRTFLLL